MTLVNNMSLVNWIGIGITAVIVAGGIVFFVRIKRKFRDLDAFEGIITQKGPRRGDHDWAAEDEPKSGQ